MKKRGLIRKFVFPLTATILIVWFWNVNRGEEGYYWFLGLVFSILLLHYLFLSVRYIRKRLNSGQRTPF
ncbi:MAG: hypothetical protein WC831_03030 [Parcubacteria group bacterium]|jgi:hypothetical protein